jgi:hypothetical protein
MTKSRSRRLSASCVWHTLVQSTFAFTIKHHLKVLPNQNQIWNRAGNEFVDPKSFRNLSPLQVKKQRKIVNPNDRDSNPSKATPNGFKQGTMDTALCIIPPDDAWDDIQRARHFARDPSFYTWPPAIRLFHPFVDRISITEVATAVAELVEKYDLESFDVTIDKLLIVPHFEDLEQHEEAQKQLPDQAEMTAREPSKDEERVQALIRSEERKGKRKLAKRKAKERAREGLSSDNDLNGEEKPDVNEKVGAGTGSAKDKSPKDKLKSQQKKMGEFNGPCVLCLEPNEESKIHIQAFREILRKKLFPEYDPFSPSSTVTNPNTLQKGLPRVILKQHGINSAESSSGSGFSKKKKEGSTFRPTITLGRFSTVTKAVETANKLQQVWDPLSFRVCDLHLVSKLETCAIKSSRDDDEMDESESADPYSIQVDEDGTPTMHENRELTLRKFHGSDGGESILSTRGEYGCDGKYIYCSIYCCIEGLLNINIFTRIFSLVTSVQLTNLLSIQR